jgi:hypothetical protein
MAAKITNWLRTRTGAMPELHADAIEYVADGVIAIANWAHGFTP